MHAALASLIIFLLTLSPGPLTVAQSEAKRQASLHSLLANYNFRRVSLQGQPGTDLLLRISINGKPASLVIATAAPVTVLDRNGLRRFGLSERRTAIHLDGTLGKTSEHVGMSKVKGLEFVNIVLADFDAPVIDESVLNRTVPHRDHLDGVFGYSQMRKLGAVLDCGHRNLYANPRGPNREASAKRERFLVERGFARIPMRLNAKGLPEVDCRVNGHAAIVTVETASFTTIIDKRLAVEAGLSPALGYTQAEGVGRRTALLSSGIAKEFSVGSLQIQGTRLSFTDVAFNVLGIDYLSSTEAIIDSGNTSLFLRHRRNTTR